MSEKNTSKSTRADATMKKRTKIVEAAAACFISKGFHQSSMRDISQVAGVSLGNLYNHFESKADLIIGLAEIEAQENQDLIALLAKNKPCMSILQKFSDRYFDEISEPGNAALTAEIFAEAMRNKDIYDIFDNNHQQVCEALVGCLRKGNESGEIEETAVSSATAAHILDLIESAALRSAMAQKKRSEKSAMKKELHRLIEKMICKP